MSLVEYSEYMDIKIAKGVCGEGEEYETKIFVYALDGIMIDCGPKILEQETLAFMRENNIEQVILTHNHEDHVGAAPWILRNTDIPVYLNGEAMYEAVNPPVMAEYASTMWGVREPFQPQPLPESVLSRSGKYRLEAVHTPGHVPHHDCFYERERGWLFSGDLYLGTKLLFAYQTENVGRMIQSIEAVLEDYDFDTIFCAHAGVIENGKVRLNKKLLFLQELQRQTRELRAQGMDDRDIASELIPFEVSIETVSKGEWSRYNIIRTL